MRVLERSVQDCEPAPHSINFESFFGIFRKCLRKMWTSVLNLGKDPWDAGRNTGNEYLFGDTDQHPVPHPITHGCGQILHPPKSTPQGDFLCFSLREEVALHPLSSHKTFSSFLWFMPLLSLLCDNYVTAPPLTMIPTQQGRYYQHHYFTNEEG